MSYDLKHIRQFDEEYIISSAFLFLFISSFKIVASTGIRIRRLPYFSCNATVRLIDGMIERSFSLGFWLGLG